MCSKGAEPGHDRESPSDAGERARLTTDNWGTPQYRGPARHTTGGIIAVNKQDFVSPGFTSI